jgi:hypothetical protein
MVNRSGRANIAKRSTAKHQNIAKRPTFAKRQNGAKRAVAVKRANGAHSEQRATFAPSKKTIGATLGSAVGGIAIYLANRHWPGVVTPDIAGMVTVVATFAVGWVVPPGKREAIVVNERGRRRTAVA